MRANSEGERSGQSEKPDSNVCQIVHDRVAEVEVVGDKESLFADKETIARFLGSDCGAEPSIEAPFNPVAARILVAGENSCRICARPVRTWRSMGKPWCHRCAVENRDTILKVAKRFSGKTDTCPGCGNQIRIRVAGYLDIHEGKTRRAEQYLLCEHWRPWIYAPTVVEAALKEIESSRRG